MTSDSFTVFGFDDGENVKVEVVNWIKTLSLEDDRGRQLEPILLKMLTKSFERASAREVHWDFLKTTFTGVTGYSDGVRIVHPHWFDMPRTPISNENTERGEVPPAETTPAGKSGDKGGKEVYLCVDKLWADPSETVLGDIRDVEGITEDAKFYRQAKEELMRFTVVWDKRNQVMASGANTLPDQATGYDYDVVCDPDAEMKLAGIQIVAGLRCPEKVPQNEKMILGIIPKKLTPPRVERESRAVGWGLHAKPGFSLKKIIIWIVATELVGLVFVILWLSCINSVDLQNAFIPVTFMTMLVAIGLGIPQLLVN
ncbi:hypothetical protein ONZ43_g7088 [Nemania bipapillata]|uniref:Uncharacterized protein n=1 Tax=Nemania bipapillata TaxID=110536 RepID=A0ACC2HTG8_9PEZI|nr:hypothetical protein ONZ43_g7088 [Nemania bipapillata]